MSAPKPVGPNSRRRAHLKAQIAARDGACCFYCGTDFEPDLKKATLDHLVPRSQVWTWAQAGLVLACKPCNNAKGDLLPAVLLRPAGRFGPGLVPLESVAS